MQANATLSIVCCQLHNLWLGFSAEQISSASTSGINQKTFQLNQLLGLPPETTPARHQLSIKADNHLPDILVSSDIHLCELSLTDIHPLPPCWQHARPCRDYARWHGINSGSSYYSMLGTYLLASLRQTPRHRPAIPPAYDPAAPHHNLLSDTPDPKRATAPDEYDPPVPSCPPPSYPETPPA